jgi:hypothetical protein
MAPWLAASIVTWAAMVILYFGLAATLRKVNVLTAELAAIRAGGAPKASGISITMPGYEGRLVLAADSACPSCSVTVKALDTLALRTKPVLLTYEEPSTWDAPSLEIRQDAKAWRAVAHLSPPVLLSIGEDARVAQLALPTHPDDVTRALAAWGLLEGKNA